MNAQQIIKMINKINPCGLSPKYRMIPENKVLLDDVYCLAQAIEPCDKYRNGIDRELWLWTDKGSFEEFADTFKSHFTYGTVEQLFYGEGETRYDKMKEKWPIYFPDDTVWFHLYLAEHKGYRGLSLNRKLIMDTSNEDAQVPGLDMEPLLKWIIDAEIRCINMIKDGLYSDYIAKNLPYKHRSGVTTLATYWKYVPKDKQRLFGKIDPDELEEFKAWDKDEDNGWTNMTSNDYFRICDCLYEILDLKSKYPMHKKDAPDDILTPKECYMAYAANYGTVKPFLELDGDSPEAFDHFVEKEYTEHHTWEVCLVPNIHLYPEKIDGKFYVSFSFDHKDDYDSLVHLTLEMHKRGMPIIKPDYVLEGMEGKEFIQITPDGDIFDWRYAESEGIKTCEGRFLPMGNCEELIKEIKWFPTKKWRMDGV